MDDANASIKRTLAEFEAGVHSSLRVRQILLDASYIVQTSQKLNSPRQLTNASLIQSWIDKTSANLSAVKKAYDALNRRRPCCLQAERCVGVDDPQTVRARKERYMHDECESLASYWVAEITPMTLRNANLQVALAIVNDRQLDLSAFRKQALRAVKEKAAEAFRSSSSSSPPKTVSEPELPPPLLPPAKQDNVGQKDKPKKQHKTVTFARSASLLGQEATHRPARAFHRSRPATYVPGRWAPPNRKPRPDAACTPTTCAPARKLSKLSKLSKRAASKAAPTMALDTTPAAATKYPLEPFDPYGPPAFFNTYADYSYSGGCRDFRTFDFASNAAPKSSPSSSPNSPISPPSPLGSTDELETESDDDPAPALPLDDMFLDTSGINASPSAFYHDDPLLDAEEWALEQERRAVWDAFFAPLPAPRRGLLQRVRSASLGRGGC